MKTSDTWDTAVLCRHQGPSVTRHILFWGWHTKTPSDRDLAPFQAWASSFHLRALRVWVLHSTRLPYLSPSQITLVILDQYQCHCSGDISPDTQSPLGVSITTSRRKPFFPALRFSQSVNMSGLIIALTSLIFNHHGSTKKHKVLSLLIFTDEDVTCSLLNAKLLACALLIVLYY